MRTVSCYSAIELDFLFIPAGLQMNASEETSLGIMHLPDLETVSNNELTGNVFSGRYSRLINVTIITILEL